jgi:hypothetical protein
MRGIPAACLAVFLIQAVTAALFASGTCDELGAHLPSGILAWKSGTFAGGLANPPVGQLLVGAGAVLSGHGDHPLRDDPLWLFPARAPVLALGVLTSALVGALGRRLGGATAGAAALGAAALCPDLVAHSGLATLDLPVTAFLALAVWAAWSWVRGAQTAFLVAWAFAFGTACLVKHSALHFLPAVALGALLAGGSRGERLRRAVTLAATAALGLVVLAWLAYGRVEATGPLPAAYVDALRDKWSQGRGGHFAYLLGERGATGFPHYFLVALAVKLPLPILVAAAAGAAALRGRLSGDARGFAAFVLLPGLWLLVAASLFQRVNIGVRHVLPLYPALLALAGAGWSVLADAGARGRWTAAALAVWAIWGAARIAPDPLTHFNELAGGPNRGDRVLIDSNLDWGQEESRVRAWAAEHGAAVRPEEPVEGTVVANVNALHGILSLDDSRLRWLAPFPARPSRGHSWRIFEVSEDGLRSAAERSPVAAMDFARWLLARSRAGEALAVLERNDLSRHEGYAREWWGHVTEARLAEGDLAGAGAAAPRSGDAALLAEVSWRISEAGAVPWSSRDPRERQAVVGALLRRDRRVEASALAERIAREHPEDLSREARLLVSPPQDSPAGRLERAETWRLVGDEERALVEAGALLAVDPGDAAALWLYGELVVRRKLGVTEYALPDIDWSRVSRRRAGARRGARAAGTDSSGARARSSSTVRARGAPGWSPPGGRAPRRST